MNGFVCPRCYREVSVTFLCEECHDQFCQTCIVIKDGRQLCPDCYAKEVTHEDTSQEDSRA